MKFKYVIVPGVGMDWAIITSPGVNHNHAVNLQELKPISAGFAQVRDGKVTVEGASVSLGLKSRPQDRAIVEISLAMMGLLKTGVPSSKFQVPSSQLSTPKLSTIP